MLKTLLCDEHNKFLVVEEAEAISEIVKHKGRQLWIDLERPTGTEFKIVQEEFRLHPLAVEDAMKRHQRPKIDQYDHFYFVVFYTLACVEEHKPEVQPGRRGLKGTRFHAGAAGANGRAQAAPIALAATDRAIGTHDAVAGDMDPEAMADIEPAIERIVLREISMFMGENFLVTVHNDPIPEFDEVAKRWYRNREVINAEKDRRSSVPGARPLTDQEQKALQPDLGETIEELPGTPEPPATKGGNGKAHPTVAATGSYLSAPLSPGQLDVPAGGNGQAEGDQANSIGILLYSMLDTIVDDYFPVIDSLVDRVEDLEEQIFEQYSQESIESIFTLKKDLLALRKVLAPERDLLNVLTRRDLPIFEHHTIIYFQDVYDHVVRITDSIDTYRDLLSSALDGFLSMQSNRLNITVQTLTSVSIMLMSIATLTGWYGMNFQAMPELSSQFGYPGVMILVVAVVAIEFLFFRRKGWL